MKKVVTVLLLFLVALTPYILSELVSSNFFMPFSLTYGVLFTILALIISAAIFVNSNGEKKFFGLCSLILLTLLTLNMIFVSYEFIELPPTIENLRSIYEPIFVASTIPLLIFGFQKLLKDSKFLKPSVLTFLSIPASLISISYLAMTKIPCEIGENIQIGVVLCLISIAVYSLLIGIYANHESSSYWISVLGYYIFFCFGFISLSKAHCFREPISAYPTLFYNLSIVSLSSGLYTIYRENLIVLSIGELEEQKRRYEELYYRVKELKDVLGTINKMLRHDILNKLQIVLSYIELYQENKNSEFLEKAKEAVKDCGVYIEKIRELERIVTSEKSSLKVVIVRDVVEDVVRKYEDRVKINVNGNCTALADEGLYSIVENLISNAVKHSGSDFVNVNLAEFDDECEIRVSDHGKGIPAEMKSKIFEEGVKYGSSGGSGLGLYIVKKLVERYNGRVWVEDNKPTGAVFVVRLKSPKVKEN